MMEGSFRGFPAPASLKLSVAADPTVGVGRRFPGLPSPGLIEAVVVRRGQRLYPPVSGASQPRPH